MDARRPDPGRIGRRPHRALALVLAATVAGGVVSTPAHAAIPAPGAAAPAGTGAVPKTVTFGIQPATADKLDSRTGFTYGATPGGQLRDQVGVVNIGVKPITVSVYVTDAVVTTDGTFSLLPGAQKPTDLGRWTSLGTRPITVTVPARSSRIVPLSLKVPLKASPGDHLGAVVASLTSSVTNDRGYRVRFDQRVASRLSVRVSGPLDPLLAISELRVSYRRSWWPWKHGSARVSYRVTNEGNVRLGGSQDVRLSGVFGLSKRSARTADLPELIPGSSVATTTRTARFPLLRLKAAVSVQGTGRPGDANPEIAIVTRSASVWTIPWSLLGLLLLLALALLARSRRRRTGPGGSGRRGRSAPVPTGPVPPDAPGPVESLGPSDRVLS